MSCRRSAIDLDHLLLRNHTGRRPPPASPPKPYAEPCLT